ncbi:MAG: hypothetical protein JWM09_271 [Francisellaceae bacterium]|nr:hypothetical protein [Francisellaceae bacterium]
MVIVRKGLKLTKNLDNKGANKAREKYPIKVVKSTLILQVAKA